MQQSKIHFCTPCYGGQITEICFSSYLQWSIAAIQNNIEFSVDTLSNESNVNRARNSCAAIFLKSSGTHLMFVDADIGWQPDYIVKLINADKDVVAGVYPQKTLPIKHVLNTIDNGEQDGNLIEVGTIGTGFMLIKRQVFQGLIEAGATPYKDDIGLGPECDKFQYDFFNCTVDSNGRYLTEDWSFCRSVRKIGKKVWADLSIDLYHAGTFRFPPDLTNLRKEYKIGTS
jgi:hypothetical protein